MKPLPNKSLEFKILNNTYKVDYPNNGQFIDIEASKARLTGDAYGSMVEGQTVSAQMARFTVDMIAFLSICCPQLRKDLNVNTFSELDMLSSKKLLKVYVDSILPWLMEWEVLLNSVDEEESEQSSKM